MRPVPDLPSFTHKPSFDHPSPSPSLDSRTTSPATFFLTRSPHAFDEEPSTPPDDSEDIKESMYGVHSLDGTLSRSDLAASSSRMLPAERSPMSSPSQEHDDLEEPEISRRPSTIKPLEPESQESPLRPPVSSIASRPLTPLHPDEPSSLPSSPKSISNQSFRPLDDISITDEISSQAIGSGDEEERSRASPHLGPGGASQLIMPSIKMPSRRPFTERGKVMDRFKVLMAGAPGRSLLIGHIHHFFADDSINRLGQDIID